jgi:hypothetical protein
MKEMKGEIRALQHAISRLTDALDRILAGGVKGWKPLQHGLNYEIERVFAAAADGTPYRVKVNIYPVGWPRQSRICCFFDRGFCMGTPNRNWIPVRGAVASLHIEKFQLFCFRVKESFPGGLLIESCNEPPLTEEEKIFTRLAGHPASSR